MIAAPGPAAVVTPLCLAVLSTEFVWAARLLRKVKEKADSEIHRVREGCEPWKPEPCDRAES